MRIIVHTIPESHFAPEIGGALLTPESVERADVTRKMIGSMLVVQATSIAEVRAKIEADIYWTSGVVSRS